MAGAVMFAELHTLSGERQESSHLVGVATPPVLSVFKRRRGQLFTVVEPSLPNAVALCRRLITTIEDEYFRDSSRSITTSLRDAVNLANDVLRAENAKASPDSQLRVGLSCAAVREDDVYVAQVAPASAFIVHDGAVKRVFCTYSVIPGVVGNDPNGAADSLGSQPEPRINFSYSPIQEGDLVVLSSGPYWKLISDRYVLDSAKHLDPEMVASDLYSRYTAHTRRPTTSLVAIKMSSLPARQSRNGHGKAEEPRPMLVEMSELSTEPTGRKKPTTPTSRGKSGSSRTRPNATTRRKPSRSSVLSDLLNRAKSCFSREREHLYPKGPPLEEVGRSSVRLKDQWPQRWSDRDERPEWMGKIAATLALAAVFVLIGNVMINSWRSWQLGDPTELVKEAQEKRALASTGDPASARTALAQAYELVSRAQRAKDDESTRTLVTSVQGDLDRMDKTVRLSQAKTLVDYNPIVSDKGDVTQLVVDGSSMYVLDEGLDRLYSYNLTQDGRSVQDPGKHMLLMKKGDKLDGVALGELFSIAWMPAGQLRTSPALFILESGRSIVSYDPKTGPARTEVAESQKWGMVQAINGFAGGLYLLDTKLKQIYYYPPTKNGYESEPYTIVDSRAKADLAKAMDLALDGNLYLLESTGGIKRFNREGRPFDFAAELPDGPMKGATSLFASANTRSLYVLDTVGERVVQFSPEGKLQRQFKATGKDDSFKELRDLFVDEAGRKLYLLARKSLSVFDLPPMQ